MKKVSSPSLDSREVPRPGLSRIPCEKSKRSVVGSFPPFPLVGKHEGAVGFPTPARKISSDPESDSALGEGLSSARIKFSLTEFLPALRRESRRLRARLGGVSLGEATARSLEREWRGAPARLLVVLAEAEAPERREAWEKFSDGVGRASAGGGEILP